jgi:CheY-like chemotaxis protein
VTLPVVPANVSARDAKVAPVARVGESGSRVVRLDGVRALVVDDDVEGLALAEAILRQAGAEVRTCSSAASAIDVLRQWRPDVVVSDIEMPAEDGFWLIRQVRALDIDEGSTTPAIALTAYGRTQDRVRSLAAGFNMHVPKPVDPGELTAIVAGIVERPDRVVRAGEGAPVPGDGDDPGR